MSQHIAHKEFVVRMTKFELHLGGKNVKVDQWIFSWNYGKYLEFGRTPQISKEGV